MKQKLSFSNCRVLDMFIDKDFWICIANLVRVWFVLLRDNQNGALYTVYRKPDSFVFKTYYNKFKKYRKDTLYPMHFALYWALGETLNYTHKYGYVTNNYYIKAVEAGWCEVPEWFNERWPNANLIPGFINIHDAINERKNDFVYDMVIDVKPDDVIYAKKIKTSTYTCDIINWCVESCAYEWHIHLFSNELTCKFTNYDDAVLFKMVWG